MVHVVLVDRVAERAYDVLLADHVVERARPVTPVERAVLRHFAQSILLGSVGAVIGDDLIGRATNLASQWTGSPLDSIGGDGCPDCS